MNKAELYKKSNPHQEVDLVFATFGGFVNYYDSLVDDRSKMNRKIKKKKFQFDPRAEKTAFNSGKG